MAVELHGALRRSAMRVELWIATRVPGGASGTARPGPPRAIVVGWCRGWEGGCNAVSIRAMSLVSRRKSIQELFDADIV
jgi:hypothetical protein